MLCGDWGEVLVGVGVGLLPALILLFVAAFVGYDSAMRSWQKSESWSGTIERTYAERGFLSRGNSPSKRYWDVRTSDGEVETVRVYSSHTWNCGHRGVGVIKREGELDPVLTGQ